MSIAMPQVEQNAEIEVGFPSQAEGFDHAPSGRLRQNGLPAADRTFATWVHLAPLLAFCVVGVFAIIAPIVLWSMRKEQSAFIDDHGRESINMSITGVLATLTLVWIPIVGWAPLVAWYIVILIAIIHGSVAASNGEYFRYPLTIRFLS